MLKKIVVGIMGLLALTQVVLIVLQILQVVNLPIIWLLAPVILGSVLAMVFMVGYVLWAENRV